MHLPSDLMCEDKHKPEHLNFTSANTIQYLQISECHCDAGQEVGKRIPENQRRQ